MLKTLAFFAVKELAENQQDEFGLVNCNAELALSL